MSVKIAELTTYLNLQDLGNFEIRYSAWQDSASDFRITSRNMNTGEILRSSSYGSFDSLNETWNRLAEQKLGARP